jgi:16S rRNA (cytidine1402-2'-O)-methyltransferase
LAAGAPALRPSWSARLRRRYPDSRRRFAEIAASTHTAVVYESSPRLSALLDELAKRCDSDRPIAVARELTKLHETIVRGTLTTVRDQFADESVRGEIVVVIGGAVPAEPSTEEATRLAESLLASGETAKSVSRELARRLRIPRNEAYSMVLALSAEDRRKE